MCRPDHRRHIWGEGLAVMLVGIGLGAGASYMLGRVLASLLFDVPPSGPLSWAVVALTLAVAVTEPCGTRPAVPSERHWWR